MRNQQYFGYHTSPDYSPLRENFNLKVDDIPGTKPRPAFGTKHTQHYETRLSNANPTFEANLQMHEKLYAMGNYHQGPNPFATSKKHYNVHHESEISRFGVMQGNEIAPKTLSHVEFPRNLTTHDIPGASPGTLQSKSVKNHDLAQKMRGNSVSPLQSPGHRDALDKFQREKQSSPEPEPFRYSNPARDSHSVQNSYNYEQPSPQKFSQDQYYAAASSHQQPDYRSSYEPNSAEEKKIKHVVFKDEPPRQETPQYMEQPHYYQEQPSQYREPAPQYREQPSHSQDYLDSYVAQNTEYNQPNSGYEQDYSRVSASRQPYSSKRDQLDQLSMEIINQQQTLEKKMRDTMRGRNFNIISNNPTNRFLSESGRRAYGSAIKAMSKNQEEIKGELGATKVWTPTGQPNPTSRQNNYAHFIPNSQDSRRIGFGPNDVAGSLNDYAETNYRYANKPGAGAPLTQDQYYGSKALKNLSGVKLY